MWVRDYARSWRPVKPWPFGPKSWQLQMVAADDGERLVEQRAERDLPQRAAAVARQQVIQIPPQLGTIHLRRDAEVREGIDQAIGILARYGD